MLTTLPLRVALIFTEPVSPAGAGIKVYSPSGAQIAQPAVARGSVLTAAIATAESGTFVVTWQVLAADTHPSRGAFSFSAGTPGSNPYSALLSAGQAGTTTPGGLALQAIARWVHFVGFALAFGVVAYQAVTRRGERSARLVGFGVFLLIAAEPLALIAQIASLSFDGDTAISVLASGFGRLFGLRLAAALALWAVWKVRSPYPILVIGAAVAVLDGASAHSVQGLAGAGLALTSVHVSAMGLWVGGTVAYLRSPDPRFGRYASMMFGLAAATGVLLAVAHLGSLAAIMTTGYGNVLMLKVAAVGLAAGAAVLRRHRVEAGLMLAIVGVAALLAALPPPR